MEGGFFRVDGADLETGEESYLVLQAASVAEAENVARKQGLLIAAVRAASPVDWGAAVEADRAVSSEGAIEAVITFEARSTVKVEDLGALAGEPALDETALQLVDENEPVGMADASAETSFGEIDGTTVEPIEQFEPAEIGELESAADKAFTAQTAVTESTEQDTDAPVESVQMAVSAEASVLEDNASAQVHAAQPSVFDPAENLTAQALTSFDFADEAPRSEEVAANVADAVQSDELSSRGIIAGDEIAVASADADPSIARLSPFAESLLSTGGESWLPTRPSADRELLAEKPASDEARPIAIVEADDSTLSLATIEDSVPSDAITVKAKPVQIPKATAGVDARGGVVRKGTGNGSSSRYPSTSGGKPYAKPVAKTTIIVAPDAANQSPETSAPVKPVAPIRTTAATVHPGRHGRQAPQPTNRRPTRVPVPATPTIPPAEDRAVEKPLIVSEVTAAPTNDVVEKSRDTLQRRSAISETLSPPFVSEIVLPIEEAEAQIPEAAGDEPARIDPATVPTSSPASTATTPASALLNTAARAGRLPRLIVYCVAPLATLLFLGGAALIAFSLMRPAPASTVAFEKLDFHLQMLAQSFAGGIMVVASMLMFVIIALVHVAGVCVPGNFRQSDSR